MSVTRFVRYVVSSMKLAKTQTIPSVVGIVTIVNANGSRNASVPKVKIRIRSAIGTAISSPLARSSANTGSRSCSIAAWPVTKTSAPESPATASRMSSVRPFESAGSRFETICATTTSSETAATETSRPVGSSAAALSAAARTCGTSAAACPSVLATTVNAPVERCPKCSSRIRSARRVSVPGSVKRFVSSPESCVEARPQRANTTIQAPSTSQRCRSTNRVSPSMG